MTFAHYPPVDQPGAERLRAATVAWAPLLGELHAVGLRPYLELEHGNRDEFGESVRLRPGGNVYRDGVGCHPRGRHAGRHGNLPGFGDNVGRVFAESEHGRALAGAGYEADLQSCAAIDSFPVVPVYQERQITKLGPERER